MTDIALSRRFFDRLAAPKRMVVLDGASHMPTEHPGVDRAVAAMVAGVDVRVRARAVVVADDRDREWARLRDQFGRYAVSTSANTAWPPQMSRVTSW